MTSATTVDDEFRQRCRAFLDEHATGGAELGEDDPRGDKGLAIARTFQAELTAAGLAGLAFPTEYGGQGMSAEHDRAWREEAARYPVMTRALAISHGMCLPVLSDFGTPEQKAEYLPKIISADQVWCQMFSEPGAGSDVASLQTRAERDGDEFVINGQKVWTTLAHLCDHGILIARTDPDQPKHRGISMFIVDMNDPAVEVRPINQVDGGRRFNEVFFTNLRVPADHLIPPENDGWRLATAMLMYERVAIGTGMTSGVVHERADELIAAAGKNGASDDPTIRQELMHLYTAEVCQSLVALQTRARLQAGVAPGPGGSLGKLAGARIAARYRDLSLAIRGPGALAWSDPNDARFARAAIATLSSGIAGGTNEIQRNIIGDRVLGLPREPSMDKDVPFRDLAVGTQT